MLGSLHAADITPDRIQLFRAQLAWLTNTTAQIIAGCQTPNYNGTMCAQSWFRVDFFL